MTGTAAPAGAPARTPLPPWLAPRPQTSDPAPSRGVWRLETAILLVVAAVLAAAVIYDVVRQVGINERFQVDRNTWVHLTHRNYNMIDVNPLNVTDVNPATLRVLSRVARSNVDIACGPPAAGVQHRFCLVLGGPSQHRTYRWVLGGYDLPLYGKDLHTVRSHCFGVAAREHWCSATAVLR